MAALGAVLLPPLLLISAWLGWRVQRALPSHHRSRDSVDSVRLVMSMLVTFSALMLSLLTSSAKNRYDANEANLSRFSIDLIQLDQGFREYGAAAEPARTVLRAYTAAAIADTWPSEPAPAGVYPRHPEPFRPGSVGSEVLGGMLLQLDRFTIRLSSTDQFHERIAASLRSRVAAMIEQRWVLVESFHPTMSWPFLWVMIAWLVLVFAIFGLSSPANGLVYGVIAVAALSVSMAVYMILDFDMPLGGLITVSGDAMRDALLHMDQPLAD